MEKSPIKILIVDDHNIVRSGMAALLDVKPNVTVIGEAANGEEAVQLARETNPDVILMDLQMPKKDGISALREIRAENPDAKILILTSFQEKDDVKAAIAAGARGYLLKDSSPADLLVAIQTVHMGHLFFHPDVSRHLLEPADQPSAEPSHEELTEREMMVLNLMVEGLTNRDIAERLSISERTVSTHVSHILEKLDVENRTQAALFAVQNGLVNN